MMRIRRILLTVAILAYTILPSLAGDKGGLTKMVDPYIGTGGHGHTFLGANVPFGLVQLGPTEPVRGWHTVTSVWHRAITPSTSTR